MRLRAANIKMKALDSNEIKATAIKLKTAFCLVSISQSIIDQFLVVTDADSDEKTENLPMILAQVEKVNFKPYKKQ